MNILKIVLLAAFLATAAFSASAINRTIILTQPDGSHFSGHLKGDSSFHWIESDGDVVVYNPTDRKSLYNLYKKSKTINHHNIKRINGK
ncbi:hypothetical protein [Sulfurimonas sp.]